MGMVGQIESIYIKLSFFLPNKMSPGGSDGKESACNIGDPCSIPGSRRSPGEGNGNPLQVTEKYLPGKFYGQKYLVGYSPGGCKESEMTEQPSMHSCTPKTNTF